MGSEYILQMEDISKSYGDNQVLQDVSLQVRPGEIVALVGENGAGKSTLMNILFGMAVIHSTGGFDGRVLLDGQPVTITSPFDAMRHGIGMVHQEFMLINGYTVAENVKLNRENVKGGLAPRLLGKRMALLDRKAMAAQTRQTLDTLGIDLDENAIVGDLPVGYKQFIEIARELDKSTIRLIVLDEPTAVLTESEAHQFLECVKSVAQRGVSFIFISHRLDEIKAYSDHVVVLRDGRLVGTYPTGEVSPVRISELMVGQEVEILNQGNRDFAKDEKPAIRLENFSVNMPGEELHNVDIAIQKGEILGIAGLAGHGKAAVANGIMGLYPSSGRVLYEGEEIDVADTLNTLRKRVMFVSEDRRNVGLLLEESIETNITVAGLRVNNMFSRRVMGLRFYDGHKGRAYTEKMIGELDIRCVGPRQHVGRLSGGNQQKVCVARAIAMEPEILFISEPTRGIDIGAKKRILDTMVALNREKGMTIVITSSELAELRAVSDRIIIITEGRVAGQLRPADEDYKFGLLMSGADIAKYAREEGGQTDGKGQKTV